MTETLEHHIAGRRVPGESGRVGQVFNPSTGDVARLVRLGGSGEVDAAVQAAQAAFPAWQATPPAARARIMCARCDGSERQLPKSGWHAHGVSL